MSKPLKSQQEMRSVQLIENQLEAARRSLDAALAAGGAAFLPVPCPALSRPRLTPPGGVPREVCLPLAVRPSLISASEAQK